MTKEKKIQYGYKKSRFGPIPMEWEDKTISDLISFSGGSQPPQKVFIYEEREGYVRLIQTRDYRTSKYKTYIPIDEVKKSCDVDDIMIGRYGPPIFQIFRGLKGAYNVALIKASPTSKMNKDYCFYFLTRPELRKYLEGLSQRSGGQTGIDIEKLNDYPFPLPPLPEQKAIANLLSTWEKAIQTTNTLIEQKQNRKKWLMQMLLTGKKRLKGFEKEKWKEVRLGEVFDERNETGNFNLPLLSVGAGGIYPQSDSIKKDTSNEDKSKYRKICVGDIGYNTMRMWQGRSALSSIEGIISPAYTVVTPKSNSDAKYYSFLFKTPHLINSFYRNSQGLVDDTLNCKYKDFAIVKTFVPPTKKEQEEIAKVLVLADKEIGVLNKKLDQMKEQKKGLMQILLTGKKRLKVN